MENEYESAPAEQPEVEEGRAKLVAEWQGKIEKARKHHEPSFKAMRESMEFAMRGADKAWKDDKKYTVPILPRYINQAVSTLYARNPKTTFKRRQRLQYAMWDGRSDSLQASMQMAQMGDATAMALIQEVLAVRQENMMLDRMGETLKIMWDYYLDEQGANYKQQLKAAVRRAKICKVAYIKLGYQRLMEAKPEITGKITDATTKIRAVEMAMEKAGAGKIDELSAEAEQLKLNLEDLQRDEMIVVREGPVLDFPKSDQIIIDPACTHLKSLSGASWLAHEFEFEPCDIKAIWDVDVGKGYTVYAPDGKPYSNDEQSKKCCRVWVVEDKKNLQTFAMCDGYKDFLKAPATPDVWTERFWSIFPIVFNEVEHHSELYPMSDVEQAMDIQREYNRSREELRQHRIASRPWWVEGIGMAPEEKTNMSTRAAHQVVSLPSLGTNQKISDLLQAGPTAPVDMNLYETEMHFGDLLRIVGYQEAQMGATSGSTATESSIAQQSQSVSQADNVDDLDETLKELARAAGQVMLLNVEKATVIEIAGDGAVWPDTPTTREAAAKEIMLEVEAGSSGRPNQAAELANMERGMPYIMQIPGINPEPLGKRYLELLNIDLEEAFAEGLPSITALNAIVSKMAAGGPAGAAPTGDPATDPNSQGGQGGQNAPNPAANEPGPQPGYTAPAPVAA